MMTSISPVIVLGFLGWILFFLALFIVFKCIESEQKKKYKAIHLSAIRDGRVGGLFKSGIIEGLPVVSEDYMEIISGFLESSEIPEGFKDDLRILKNLDLIILKGDFVAICKKLNCPAITAGEGKRLEIQGIECINIRDLDNIGKSNIIRGQKITVNFVDYGYDKARGFLEDGTVVEISGKTPEKQPVTLECIVDAVMESKFNRKIWARVRADD